MITSFDEMVQRVKDRPCKTIAVTGAESKQVLSAVSYAHQQGLADAVLVGDREKIIRISEEYQIDISAFDIVNTTSETQSVVRSLQLVREKLADTLMKGTCSTATLLRGVLEKEHGLRHGKLLSHVAVFELSTYHKLLFMSDGGMNIYPDLNGKIGMIENAVQVAKYFKIRKPKVAMITALEKVNHQAMPCTVDAAVIAKMYDRGQITDCIVDGPLALDNAINKQACEIKGIKSPVGGDADILIFPVIEVGNVFYKAMTCLTDCRTAGIVMGAKVPVIVSSRSDSEDSRFFSIALAMLIS